MNSLSFSRSVTAAFIISALAACTYYLVTAIFGNALSESLLSRGCLSGATFAYLLYLLKHADVSFGKLSLLSLFALSQLGMLYWWPTILVYSVINIAFIWLVRAVYYHSNVVLVLIDFCVCVISLLVAVLALYQSHSLFMCLWSFFLAQAFVLPLSKYMQDKWFKLPTNKASQAGEISQRFYQAHAQAEDALRKMA